MDQVCEEKECNDLIEMMTFRVGTTVIDAAGGGGSQTLPQQVYATPGEVYMVARGFYKPM